MWVIDFKTFEIIISSTSLPVDKKIIKGFIYRLSIICKVNKKFRWRCRLTPSNRLKEC